jgi:metallophosphoesterase superfamily enzyme
VLVAVLSDIHANLAALEAVVADAERRGCDTFVCLGDTVGYGPEPVRCVEIVRRRCSAIVEGNHDRAAGLRRLDLPLEIQPALEIDGVTFIHDPADLPSPVPAVCGHLHPSIRLPESPRRRTRVPCFHLHRSLLALPGFGSFTGTHPIEARPGDRVFVPLRDHVRELPVPKSREPA